MYESDLDYFNLYPIVDTDRNIGYASGFYSFELSLKPRLDGF